jgi:hypothetical protein
MQQLIWRLGRGWRMDRKTTKLTTPQHRTVFEKLGRIKTRELRLRDEKVALLRVELTRARELVQSLERELRLLGDHEAAQRAGRIAWDEVYDQLGAKFAANDMRELTGASPNLVASIVFRWKRQRRIAPTSRRGVYRKVRES